MKHREGHTQRHHRGSEALIAIMLVVMPCVMDTSSVAEPTTMQRAGAGGPVEFGISAKSTEQGIPIVITIQVNNANTIGEVQLPEGTSSVTMRVLPGSNRSESMSFINGKTSRVVSEFFRIEVTPLVEGTIEIPSISIDVDGSVFSTPLTSIQVSRGVQQEDLASAAVESPDQSIWLGEAIDLTLTIQMRAAPVVDTDSLLDARSMWGCIDVQGSDWGPFTESMMRLIQSNRIPSAEQLPLADGLEYVWRIPVRYFADTAGIPDLSAVSIRIGYPAKVGRQRDMFGTHTAVLQRRPITLTPTIAGLEVKPLPIEGRPDSFTGAVGTFDVIASAKPTSVSAGDPITLDFLVRDTSGRAELASVQPPNLAAAVGMENDFAIPTTKSGGLVKDDVKLFTQTLRPLSEDVRQIPAIPFSWFDPTTDTYCTASTLPLSISVAPSARMDRDSIVGRRLSGNDPTQIASASEKSDSPPVLVPASASLLARQSPRSAWGTALAIAIPPAVFAAFLTIVATRRNAASHPERQRKRDALKVARGALLGGDPERAITGLIEDRLGRPANTLTTKDLGVILVTPETAPLASAARSVMDRCTAARYGGKSIDPSILAETAALLPQLAKALVLTFVLLGAIGTSSACGADSAPDLATLVRAEEAFARGESIR
ncbi:MAG: BatD family protein [Planctomycetota bacterium]|nr:BatD family protein [Planctomycetota bacterium]